MDQKLNKAINRRSIAFNRLKEIFRLSEKVTADPLMRALFRTHCMNIDAIYEEFQTHHNTIIGLLPDDKDFAAHDAIRLDSDRHYYASKTVFFQIAESAEAHVETPVTASHSRARLPKITLPTFDGNFKNWTSFFDLFNSLIHQNKDLSNVERFHYLLTSLTGEPHSLLKTIPMTDDNYTVAYDTLVKRYQNKRYLATNYYNEIFNAPALQKPSCKDLRKLLDIFSENLAALKLLHYPVDQWEFIIFNQLLNKLDAKTRTDFELKFASVLQPTYPQLRSYLEEHCRSLTLLQVLSPEVSKPRSTNDQSLMRLRSKSSNLLANTENTACFEKCVACLSTHALYRCPIFSAKDVDERFSIVKKNRLCINCLRPNHMLRECPSKTHCRICNSHHHTLLHRNIENNLQRQDRTSENSQNNNMHPVVATNNTACTSTRGDANFTVLLSTAEAEIIDSKGNVRKVRILFDTGSQSNFITYGCAKRLGLRISHLSIPIEGLNASTTSTNGVTKCIIRPRNQTTPTFDINAIVLPKICAHQPRKVLDLNQWSHIRNLKLADRTCHLPGAIDMLIGAEFIPYMFGTNRIFGQENEPIAVETIFGWVLQGRASCPTTLHAGAVTLHASLEPSLEACVRKFWEIDSLPKTFVLSPEDQQCETLFTSTVSRDVDNRFIVSLPFRHFPPRLGDSYDQAAKRLVYLENRLAKNPELSREYQAFMQDYIESKHMSLLPVEQFKSSKAFYIPHHCIIKPESTTTRLRVVFDASAKSSSGFSLNDEQFAGPKLQTDIFAVLLNFRKFPIVFTADIRQMYRQILVTPDHRDFQRILWRISPNKEIQEFRLNTVTYGVASSPYLALRTMQELAKTGESRFPRASEVLKREIYVDDIVTGADTIEAAQALLSDLRQLLESACFELRKFASNQPRVLSEVSDASKLPVTFDKEDPFFIKILGLYWDPSNDSFTYSCKTLQKQCSKRSILSEIARIYDPLGFLSPTVLFAKNLLQKLWLDKVDWDDEPPSTIRDDWHRFHKELPQLRDIKIPRYLFEESFREIELHAFCDASQIGYAAAVYIRIKNSAGNIYCKLLSGKSKIAPTKTVSIPRLELLGAVLLTDLVEKIVKSISHTFDAIYAWSDSEIVLTWLSDLPARWKTFVANRVSHIQEIVPFSNWRYVPSLENPADCASRGILPSELCNHSLWWHGPEFLSQSSENWPPQPIISSSKGEVTSYPEAKTCLLAVENHPLSVLLIKFSSFAKIVRIVAFVLRFIVKPPQRKQRSVNISSCELQKATIALVKVVQLEAFPDVIVCLNNKHAKIPKPFRRLNLFLDEGGCIRVGGRLGKSSLDFEAKHPLLLPSNHIATIRIIEDAHRRFLHPGVKTLSNLLLQQYWILSARRVIRRCLANCLVCFRTNPKSLAPIMADLPSFRVSQIKPFSTICLDYAGPVFVTMSKARGVKATKAYICVFVCCAIKAIHLELVSDLSSEAFLAAFHRFVSRRGTCTAIHSDQGTNFIGANNRLQELAREAAVKLDIAWYFNPPSSPHFNGLAEAGVKSVKTHLTRVIGDQILTFEELTTLLTRIEAVLNSRPLCPMSSDPCDLQPLVPSHFLVLEPLNNPVPDPDLSQIPLNRLSRWQLLQQMHSQFWKRWHLDYLNTLQQRAKWNQPGCNVDKDMLVLVKEDNQPPNKWHLARIVDTHPGTDGIVRVVTLRTAKGTYQRPTVKLCPLPLV